jgi:hypothetical protein
LWYLVQCLFSKLVVVHLFSCLLNCTNNQYHFSIVAFELGFVSSNPIYAGILQLPVHLPLGGAFLCHQWRIKTTIMGSHIPSAALNTNGYSISFVAPVPWITPNVWSRALASLFQGYS